MISIVFNKKPSKKNIIFKPKNAYVFIIGVNESVAYKHTSEKNNR